MRQSESRISTAPLPDLQVAELPVGPAPHQVRILVVDDEPSIGSAIRRLFRRNEVIAVTSGHDALGLLQRGERFDVVICDARMPRMSGQEFRAQVRLARPELANRFVFLTGSEMDPDDRSNVGVPVIAKPFGSDELRREVFEAASRWP